MINKQNTSATLNSAIATSQELLTTYAFGEELLGDFTTAFGSEYNRDAAANLITQWQTGDFDSFPEIEIRNSAEINGANGAYSVDTNKIYISEEYLLANANNINAVSDLVIEEYGHYVDARINPVDAAGDEGDIFSSLVRGESFTDDELQQLKLENDKAVITLDGEEIAIEQGNFSSNSDDNIFIGGDDDDTYSFDADSPLGTDVISENTIALKSYHNRYLRAGGNGQSWQVDQVESIGPWEKFTVLTTDDGKVALESYHNRYLRAGSDGESWRVNQAEGIGPWEEFTVSTTGDGKVALKSYHNRYLRAGSDGESWRVNQGGGIGSWEKFTSISQNSDLDTLDFSQTTTQSITIDLSRYEQQSINDNLSLRLDSALGIDIENVIGGDEDDTLIGNELDNSLTGGLGDDRIDGGDGNDVAVYSGLFSDYDIVQNENEDSDFLVTNTTTLEQDRITNIEEIQFEDQSYSLPKESLFPTLSVSEQNITGLIKEWGDKFAQQQGSSIAGNIDLSGVNFELTDLDYQQAVEIPSTGVSFTGIFLNNTGNEASQTVEINDEKILETTITTENQTSLGTTEGVEQNSSFSVSNTVTASASVEVFGVEAGVENSLEIGAEYQVSENLEQTFGQVLTQSQSETDSQTSGTKVTNSTDISPQSVLYNNILTLTGTSDVPITMSYSVGGDFEFSLENGESYTVPINAILQHYDLQDGQFDTFEPSATANLERTNLDGIATTLSYYDTLNFDLQGSLELESTFFKTTNTSVTDVLLNGSLLNGNSLAGLEIIRDELGAPQQVRYTANAESERLWIVQDSLTSNMQHDLITGYAGNDQIGISHSQIDAIDDLTISYSGGNADIHFGEQHLARLNGVDPNSLDSSDFVFSTVGTIFDSNTRIGVSSNQIDSFDDLDISYSNGNADIQFEGETLTTLSGVEPNSLDSSDFVFETEGTALDSGI